MSSFDSVQAPSSRYVAPTWLCLVVAAAFAIAACKSEPSPRQEQSVPGPAQLDTQSLCQAGGATYDEAAGACVCSANGKWDGNRCIAAGEAVAAETACAQSGGTWKEGACACQDGKTLTDQRCLDAEEGERNAKLLCKEAGGEWDEGGKNCDCPDERRWTGSSCSADKAVAVDDLCEAAKGTWDGDKDICDCGGKKVLAIDQCKLLKGRLDDDTCKRAANPGTWLRSRCICDDDQVFIPGRGGCAKRVTDDETLERICEDSLNAGTWRDSEERCRCPFGKLWFEQSCTVQDDLSSREVCESDYHLGKWNASKKVCVCPVESIWINQSCTPLTEISQKDACESEVNGGQWDVGRGTCVCPAGTGWIANIKRCDVGGITAAQQLCLQSGGRPTSQAGACNCPSGLQVDVLVGQGYQYCRRADNDNELPDWLLILLGILNG